MLLANLNQRNFQRLDDELRKDAPTGFLGATNYPSNLSRPQQLFGETFHRETPRRPAQVSKEDDGSYGITRAFFEGTPLTWNGGPIDDRTRLFLAPGDSLYAVCSAQFAVSSAGMIINNPSHPGTITVTFRYKNGLYTILGAELQLVREGDAAPAGNFPPNGTTATDDDINGPTIMVFPLGTVDDQGDFIQTGYGNFLVSGTYQIISAQGG